MIDKMENLTNKPSDLYSNVRSLGAIAEVTDASTTGDAIKAIIEKQAKDRADAEKAEADKLGDEAFTTEEDSTSSKTFLGMPRVVAIGVGVALLAIGGFIAYKKFVAKP